MRRARAAALSAPKTGNEVNADTANAALLSEVDVLPEPVELPDDDDEELFEDEPEEPDDPLLPLSDGFESLRDPAPTTPGTVCGELVGVDWEALADLDAFGSMLGLSPEA